jgi:hypothetical protein
LQHLVGVRRDMTAAQKVMAYAFIDPDPEKVQ